MMKVSRIGWLVCGLIGCRVDGYFVLPDVSTQAAWVMQLGGEDRDSGRSIALDGDNNLIAVGGFSRTITAGPELTSRGGADIFVVKLDSSTGNVIWAKRFGGTAFEAAAGVAVDHANNIYIVGEFEGSVDFGGGSLTAAGASAAFVLKLDANGSFGWARKIDGSGTIGTVAAIAAAGDAVVVAGAYTNSITVDTTTLMSAGAGDIYVLEVSASTGATIWLRSFGGTSDDGATGVALDGTGDVVVTGSFSGTVDFGGFPPLSTSNPAFVNGFLLKLAAANGAHLLSKQFGSPKFSLGEAVAVDASNNIFVAGSFDETLELGCADRLTASQAITQNVFLVKHTPAGSCIWARGYGGTAFQGARAIAVNDLGEVAITGAFHGSISFGGATLSSAGASSATDVFAARFAGDGVHLHSVRVGGTSQDIGDGIAHRSDGAFFVTGELNGFAEFGDDTLNAVGLDDAFIAGFPPL